MKTQTRRAKQLGGLLSTLLFAILLTRAAAAPGDSARELFKRRIMPIFKSPNPSSCTECHLAGVDLKNYILPSHEKTFLSLRDQGLIDLKNPGASKILRFISMRDETKKGVSLISEKTRQAEYEAFREWIVAAAGNVGLREAPRLSSSEVAKPSRPVEVIRYARTDRVLLSFVDNIWAQRFRCLGCHAPEGSENAKLVAEHGEKVSWIKSTPLETMHYLIASDDLINTRRPERSRLLLKPLNEIKHGGGQKMLPGDLGYKAFRTWLEDYAKVANDLYTAAGELPKAQLSPEAFPTEIWFKIVNTPPAWADRLLQVRLYDWDEAKKNWETTPIAETDRMVWGKGKLWQHTLLLLAPKSSERANAWKESGPNLPPGRYLVKVHVDAQERLKQDGRLN